jgi:REP element-mobilizing transposase RayT
MKLHRNSQKRFYNEEFTYVVTVNVEESIPFFREEIFCELWVEELKLCKELKEFMIFGFCLNYDHFHMVVKPGPEANISEIIRSLKINFSRNVNRILGFTDFSKKETILLKARSRDRAYRVVRLKHFEKVKKLRERFFKKYGKQHEFSKFKWQKSFYDHVIRCEYDFEDQSDYVIYNFLEHGLPKNWKYTSLNFPGLLDTA